MYCLTADGLCFPVDGPDERDVFSVDFIVIRLGSRVAHRGCRRRRRGAQTELAIFGTDRPADPGRITDHFQQLLWRRICIRFVRSQCRGFSRKVFTLSTSFRTLISHFICLHPQLVRQYRDLHLALPIRIMQSTRDRDNESISMHLDLAKALLGKFKNILERAPRPLERYLAIVQLIVLNEDAAQDVNLIIV